MKIFRFSLLATLLTITMSILSGQVLFQDMIMDIPGLTASWYYDKASIQWGDYNNDGFMDVLISGRTTERKLRLYRNELGNSFSDTGILFPNADGSSAGWGDYDNDGDLDIVASSNSGIIIFRNDGNDAYFVATEISRPSINWVAWVDCSNDGKLDILAAGSSGLIVYINDSGVFSSYQQISQLTNISHFEYLDIDNDGDFDLFFSGWMEREFVFGGSSITLPQVKTVMYLNHGGQFNEHLSLNDIEIIYTNSGDIDSDGWTDILFKGSEYCLIPDGMGEYFYATMGEYVYKYNFGSGLVNNYNLFGDSWHDNIALGDFDNDGDLEVINSGNNFHNGVNWEQRLRLYENIDGSFYQAANFYLGLSNPKFSCADYDNDGKLDVAITGRHDILNQAKTILYRNISNVIQNSAPSIPMNIRTESYGDYIKLAWDMATDNETPSMGLTYNIRIGTSPGGQDIMSSMSENDGSRLVSGKGLVNGNCFWKIHKSVFHAGNDYYWSVQAIDNNYKGSAFSASCVIPLPDPQIELVSSESMNFGNIYSGTSSEWLPIEFRSTGLGLTVLDVYLKHNSACFQIDQSSLGDLAEFGSIGSILVMFSPESPGAYVDTLCIVSNAINLPIIEIRLSGNSVYVPPQPPNNLNVVITDSDILLSWQAVNHDVLGHPITPDGYMILYNEIPNDNEHFWYLGFTESTNYTHHYVNIYRDSMFYKVVAVIYSRNEMLNRLKDLNESKVKYQWKQVKEILSDSEMDHLYNDD